MKTSLRFPVLFSLIPALSLGLLLAAISISSVPSSAVDKTPERESAVEGQAKTQLPDGSWLITGGNGPTGAMSTISIMNSHTGVSSELPQGLRIPRAWHTATMLPDGSVLILGGIGHDGRIVQKSEIFNPETQQSEVLPYLNLGPAPRAHHSATLLTEGRVLVAGGIGSESGALRSVELWDPRHGTRDVPKEELRVSRSGQAELLLPNGKVLLWGGKDDFGADVGYGELYDPENQTWSIEAFPARTAEGTPFLETSIPKDGAVAVPTDSLIALRFSRVLPVELINSENIRLEDPQGRLSARVVPAEGGILAFINPISPLIPGTTYTVYLSHRNDTARFPITKIMFETARDSGDDEDWIPDDRNIHGDWRSHRPDSTWQSLPPLQASPGITAIAGQALTLDGKPLARVTIRIEDASTLTDGTGRFLLVLKGMSGHCEMLIDGRTASRPNRTYGIFEAGVYVAERRTNRLPYTIWMPKIDTNHAVKIPSPTNAEVTVTTPLIPGLEVHIPPQTVIRDHSGLVVTEISITPLPTDRTPFPLPSNVHVPVYFTIQPGGAYVYNWSWTQPGGVRLVYPNYRHEIPGTRANFWHYEPEERGWYIYGQGTVTADGKQIVPDPGVSIYEFTGAMINTEDTPPSSGPPPRNKAKDGEPVDLATGLFVNEKTDLFLPYLHPINFTRTYRQGDTASRPFGIGATHPYAMFLWSANQYQEADLILPDGGRVHYVRISPGTGVQDAVFEHTATPTAFFKSRMAWNGHGWDLTLKDGTVYVFGENAPLQSIRDRYGNRVLLTHANGQLGNITRITSPNQRWIELTYDTSNRIIQAKDNIGRLVIYSYDASGRLSTVTDPKGGVTTYTYDTAHRMLTITDPRSILYLTNQYDANGRVIRQTQADNSTYQFAYTLDGGGKITQTDVTDPMGYIRRVTFNSSGYTLTDTRALFQPEEQTITYEREAGTNLVLNVTDGLGRHTAYLYDPMGNVESVTRLAGTAEAVTYTMTYEPAFNQVATISDPLNHTTVFEYDASGSLSGVTDPLQHHTTFVPNAAGQLASVTDSLQHTVEFAYDCGDLVGVTNPLGQQTRRFLDGAGRVISVTNALGQTSRFEYDPLNQVTSATDPLGNITAFSYDPNGNLLSVTDARGNVTTYTYNNMDRLATRRDPLLRTESFQYDGNGNLYKFTDRRGKVQDLTHDGLNRRTFVGFGLAIRFGEPFYEGGTAGYFYDAGSRLTSTGDSVSGTITLGYDNLDRLISETNARGSVSYAYDNAGRRTGMTVAGQPPISYAYDDADRLTGITQGASTVVLGYDDANRRTSLTLPNGIVVGYGYDFASRLTGITYALGPTSLGDLAYAYDQAGQRTQVSGSFARTGLPQALTSATYDAANQLTTWGATILTYDANGNVSSDGASSYIWDARNQLASMSGGVTASFKYDTFRRRYERTAQGSTTKFLYDAVNPVQELSGSVPTANLITGLGIDEYYLRTDAGGARNFLTDALGSTLALSDSAASLQTQYTYEPFGKATASGDSSTSTFQYTGRENDGTGLYYYRARYYEPKMGRFISEDPMGFRAGVNFYTYVLNSPVNFTDPTGLYCCQQSFGDCLDACLKAGDPIEGWKKVLLLPGATFPKSWLGIARALGSSPVTTAGSVAESYGATGMRALGRVMSPVWIGYGLSMLAIEGYCASACASDQCMFMP